jgi:TM2 domain-containing membrane protein YozV
MGAGSARNPWVAGLLSGLLPGLGQFYNRQWGKGAGFLLGVFGPTVVLSSLIDPKALEQAAEAGQAPDSLGLIFLLLVVILAVAVWSLVDAVRTAKQS